MIWIVWNSVGETEADARRIDEQSCVEAAEEWARRDGAADPMAYEQHLRNGLDLRARLDGHGQVYRVVVAAEATVHYSGKEGW